MNPVEYVISLLAPHICVGCGAEPSILCSDCATLLPCPPILNSAVLNGITARAEYSGLAKEVIHALKFSRAKACGHTVAGLIAQVLPPLPSNTVVCPIPTTNGRIRARGYDQAVIIARSLARQQKFTYSHLLRKAANTHQVGATRAQRIAHMKVAYSLSSRSPPNVLLIDDIMTTGSSLEAAARLLKNNGADEVHAAVFAYQPSVK